MKKQLEDSQRHLRPPGRATLKKARASAPSAKMLLPPHLSLRTPVQPFLVLDPILSHTQGVFSPEHYGPF